VTTIFERKHREVLERVNEKQAAEIQRLRAAMVHAMADCGIALGGDGLGTHRTYVQAAHTALRVALERP
jgi:hypothetical protein